MRTDFLIISLLSLALTANAAEKKPKQSSPKAVAEKTNAAESGFKSMFNGKDLTGWTGDPRLWSMHDGIVVGETSVKNPIDGNTFLIWTNGNPGDFELRCSFRITPHNDQNFANSGIQYRSKVLDPTKWVVGGYQADMEAGPNYSGILYEERMTRGIMATRGEKVEWTDQCAKRVAGSLGTPADFKDLVKKGEWNEYRIVIKGNHLQHFINGKQTVDVTDNCVSKRAERGVIALQLHKGGPMQVEFKEMRLKELSGDDAASAEDLKQMQGVWHVVAVESSGQQANEDQISDLVLTIDENHFDVTNLGVPTAGSFNLDATKSPKQIEIHATAGPEAGHDMPGIYECNGDKMRVCYSRREDRRPKAFSTEDNANFVMLTYTRKKS